MHLQIFQTLPRGRQHWLSEPTTCFRIMRKEICFHKISLMMPKRIGYKISTIFFICTCRRQDDQNWYSWSREVRFKNLFLELVACDIRHADKYWIRPKMSSAEVAFLTMYEGCSGSSWNLVIKCSNIDNLLSCFEISQVDIELVSHS